MGKRAKKGHRGGRREEAMGEGGGGEGWGGGERGGLGRTNKSLRMGRKTEGLLKRLKMGENRIGVDKKSKAKKSTRAARDDRR